MKTRIPLPQAEALANKIAAALAPGCDKIAIAGSIRRQRATVGDIEIVAIPTIQPANGTMVSLIDGQASATESALDSAKRVAEKYEADEAVERQAMLAAG